MMKTSIPCSVSACVLALLISMLTMPPAGAENGPTISVCTDRAVYFEGDTLQAALACWNYGEAVGVDAYAGLLLWSGAFYTLDQSGAWSGSILPWIKNAQVPSPMELYWLPFINLKLPPALPAGQNAFLAVLTKSGSPNWACDLSDVWFSIAPPLGAHYYVNGNTGNNANSGTTESAAWKTITHALAQVSAGPASPVMIHVAPGTYAPSTNGEQYPLDMKSYVYLRGGDGGTTTLDAEKSAYHVITCGGRILTVIEGFTITGGAANGPADDDTRGGGIYCHGYAVAIIQNNVIEGNVAAYGAGIYFTNAAPVIHHNLVEGNDAVHNGGGICVDKSPWASVLCNTIRSNSADYGAGIYCDQSSPEVRNNLITLNQAREHGGGIYYLTGSSLIANNMIKENSALGGDACGGGIYCHEGSTATIRNNAIIGNAAMGDTAAGGGIHCFQGAAPLILNNMISLNRAEGTVSGLGGGIYCQLAPNSLEIRNCNIVENTASSEGGGILCQCGSPAVLNNSIRHNTVSNGHGGGIGCKGTNASAIANNTVAGNSAPLGKGGGLWVDSTSTPAIKDCIIYGNTAQAGDEVDSPVNPSYCCIGGWTGGGTGNIAGDPKFAKGPFGLYYLDSQSPCIDAGSQTSAAAGLDKRTLLVTGTPDSGTVDIGYHYLLP
jgi:nitrous oxidase accessory protein NosD